jgi:hypothetical protein
VHLGPPVFAIELLDLQHVNFFETHTNYAGKILLVLYKNHRAREGRLLWREKCWEKCSKDLVAARLTSCRFVRHFDKVRKQRFLVPNLYARGFLQ